MILIDTSVWVSYLSPKDSNHDKAEQLFLKIKAEDIIVFDYIYTEGLTVFRNKVADTYCTYFTQFLLDWDIPLSFTDHVLIRLATEYFFQFKKLSFTDCLILASAKVNDYEIATFDTELMKAAKIALAQ